MAPAAADFTVDGSGPATWDDTAAAVLSALGTEFDVRPERGPGSPGSREQRTTWLDTFDWRLHKAGLVLEYVTSRGPGELRLSRTAGAPGGLGAAGGDSAETADDGITQLVAGWQAARPHLLAGLVAGPVTSRIAGIVAPRALIPVATVGAAAVTYRLLNADRKTVARLLVTRPRLIRPAGAIVAGAVDTAAEDTAAGELAPRLAVTEVRGYQAQARRAARLIAAVPGITTGGEPPSAEALRVLGRRPGDYSNKVDAKISAALPSGAAAAAILLRLLDTIEANVPGTLADADTEFLHDLRVSVRRTRSAVKLFGDCLAGVKAGELAFFAAEFKWVGDLTTPTRDLDVHLLDFEATARGLAAAKPDDLEPFRSYLEQRRRREFRALTRGLRSDRFTTLVRDWRTRLTEAAQAAQQTGRPTGPPGGTGRAGGAGVRSARLHKATGGTAGLMAAERTRVAFAKVARRGTDITPDSPAESLHDLRKRCKELRYALEFFAPLHDPASYAKVVGDLKRLQDCLGDFQDTEIQIAEIRTLAAAMLAQREAPAVTLLAMGETTAGLAARQRTARADFERRFAAFAGLEGRRRMSALLRGRNHADADLRQL